MLIWLIPASGKVVLSWNIEFHARDVQKGDDEGGGTLILDIFEFLSEPFRLKFVAGVEELVSNESRGGK